MTTTHPHPSIWAQMSYIPPRGPCAQKLSMLTTCPCHRFMIHPLKAATSFECDGCGHHASFHRMANADEEVVVRGLKDEARKAVGQGGVGGDAIENGVVVDGMREKKRRRMIEGPFEMVGAWGAGEEEDEEDVNKEVVDKAMAKEIQRYWEREEERKKEVERERAREGETLGRGRKRKGR